MPVHMIDIAAVTPAPMQKFVTKIERHNQ